MLTGIPCTHMRGGTSKGLFFLASSLPSDPVRRDAVLLRAMGSPDDRQIDGVGGAHPLTSKIAIVSKSDRPCTDVDYLFLQVVVDKAEVSDSQNCGNMLAGVGPFAIEQGLVAAQEGHTDVRIHMLNTGSDCVARVCTPNGVVEYEGDAAIDGVPGGAAPIPLDFLDVAGSSCGALLPTGNAVDLVNGVEVTCIDNGMPVVLLRASDFGLSGYESPQALETNAALKEQIEAIRLAVGERMNLGDVARKTVPKMSLLAPAQADGTLCTRTFIPHRVHEAIGVLGAVSVATGCLIPGSIAHQITAITVEEGTFTVGTEHPTGSFSVELDVKLSPDGGIPEITRSALLRTARKLMSGEVFVPAAMLAE